MPRTTRVGDQWASCDRCGILTPLSRLIMSIEGYKLCDRYGCRDRIDNDAHLKAVSRLLSQPSDEGTDRRADLYFQIGDEDTSE